MLTIGMLVLIFLSFAGVTYGAVNVAEGATDFGISQICAQSVVLTTALNDFGSIPLGCQNQQTEVEIRGNEQRAKEDAARALTIAMRRCWDQYQRGNNERLRPTLLDRVGVNTDPFLYPCYDMILVKESNAFTELTTREFIDYLVTHNKYGESLIVQNNKVVNGPSALEFFDQDGYLIFDMGSEFYPNTEIAIRFIDTEQNFISERTGREITFIDSQEDFLVTPGETTRTGISHPNFPPIPLTLTTTSKTTTFRIRGDGLYIGNTRELSVNEFWLGKVYDTFDPDVREGRV